MTNIPKPFVLIYPGEVIKDEIEARGISQKKLSEILGVPYTMLNEILNGKRNISTETALLVEAALNISAEMLVNMQSAYNLQVARKDKTLKEKFDAIRLSYASSIL